MHLLYFILCIFFPVHVIFTFFLCFVSNKKADCLSSWILLKVNKLRRFLCIVHGNIEYCVVNFMLNFMLLCLLITYFMCGELFALTNFYNLLQKQCQNALSHGVGKLLFLCVTSSISNEGMHRKKIDGPFNHYVHCNTHAFILLLNLNTPNKILSYCLKSLINYWV